MPWPRTTAGLVLKLAGHTPPTPQPQGRPPFVAVRPCSEIAVITPLVLVAKTSTFFFLSPNKRIRTTRGPPRQVAERGARKLQTHTQRGAHSISDRACVACPLVRGRPPRQGAKEQRGAQSGYFAAPARTHDRRTNDATCGPQGWLTKRLHDGRIRSVRSPLRRPLLLATPIATPLQCGRPQRSGLLFLKLLLSALPWPWGLLQKTQPMKLPDLAVVTRTPF